MGCLSNVLQYMLQVQLWGTLQGIGMLPHDGERVNLVLTSLNGEA